MKTDKPEEGAYAVQTHDTHRWAQVATVESPYPSPPRLPDHSSVVVEVLKTLISVRGVALEVDGLDEALVEQAYKYADLCVKVGTRRHNAAMQLGDVVVSARVNPPIVFGRAVGAL